MLLQNVSFETAAYSVLECDGSVSLEVTRRPAVGPLRVYYATRPGTATADEDYVSAKGTLEFQDGEITKDVRHPVTVFPLLVVAATTRHSAT